MRRGLLPDLTSLQTFECAARHGNFSRAAEELNLTQSAVSRQIKELEAQTGQQLFERIRQRVVLSAAGEQALPEVRRLLAEADALPHLAQAAAAGLAGRLRLAFVSSIAYGPLPGWLSSFRDAHADVALQLREATLDVQLAAFDADEIDAGFVLHAPGAVPPGLGAATVLTEPLVMALPESHPAAALPVQHLADVAAEPLVIFPRQFAPSLYDAVLAAYRAHGATPLIGQEAIQMQTIVNLVSAAMGLAWVPESVTRLQRPGVVYRAVADAALSCQTSLVWRLPPPPVVQRFVAHVRGHVQGEAPAANAPAATMPATAPAPPAPGA